MHEPRALGRRELLAGVGASIIPLSGCLTTLNPLGQRIRYGDIDEPTAGEPVYRDWIPDELGANSVVGSSNFLSYQVPGERGEKQLGAPPEHHDSDIKRNLQAVGVDFQSFEYLVGVGDTTLGRAQFDRDSVRETILDSEYEPAGEYRGFEFYYRYRPGYRERTIAVGDELLAFARGGPEQVRQVLDTGSGQRARHHEASDAFGRLVTELGGMPITSVVQAEADDGQEIVASGSGLTFDESAAYSVMTRVYADDASISRAELEGRLADGLAGALDATRVDIRIDEPVVTIVLKFDHGSYREMFGPLFAYPVVTWGFDHDGEELTISHLAGDELDASRFTLLDARPDEPTDEQFDGIIEPGDSLTVDLRDRNGWQLRFDGEIPDSDERWPEFNIGKSRFQEREDHGFDHDEGSATTDD